MIMNKFILLKLCVVIMIFIPFFSCDKTDREVPGAVDLRETLNDNGQAFMNVIMESPDWEKDWEHITKYGKPCPNLALYLFNSELGFMELMPVLQNNTLTHLVIWNFTEKNGQSCICPPKVYGEREINADAALRGFFSTSNFKDWASKGIQLGFTICTKSDDTEDKTILTRGYQMTSFDFPASCWVTYLHGSLVERLQLMQDMGRILERNLYRVAGSMLGDYDSYGLINTEYTACLRLIPILDFFEDEKVVIHYYDAASMDLARLSYVVSVWWEYKWNRLGYLPAIGGIFGGFGSGAAGGVPSPPSYPQTEEDPYEIKKIRCNRVAMDWKMEYMYSFSRFKEKGLMFFIDNFKNKPVEYGYGIVGTEDNGIVGKLTPPGTSGNVEINIECGDGNYTLAYAHNHTDDSPPSSADLLALAKGHELTGGNFTTLLAVTNYNKHYALQVCDPTRIRDFIEKYENNKEFLDNYFDSLIPIFRDDVTSDRMNDNEASIFAFAAMLDRFETGVQLFVADDSYDFKLYETRTEQDLIGRNKLTGFYIYDCE